MSNIVTKSSGERIIKEEVKVNATVADDPSPALAADLNGNGKNVTNVNDLQVETINGQDLVAVIQGLIGKLSAACEALYAPIKHIHPEIAELKDSTEKALQGLQPKGEYAPLRHAHDYSEILGLTKAMQDLIAVSPVPSHSHPELSESLQQIQQQLPSFAPSSELKRVWAGINAVLQEYNSRFEQIEDTQKDLSNQISALKKLCENQKIELSIVEAPKESNAVVIATTPQPYIQLNSLPVGDYVVSDARGQVLPTKIVGSGTSTLLTFAGGQGPYSISATL